MEIYEPVALARLPRPLQNNGQVQFGSVWALHGRTKKRRHEICTAVDGDSINIYEVQGGRTIFSHAVPPSTTFACAPCSIRWKDEGVVNRQTCYADGGDGGEGLRLRSVRTKGDLTSETQSAASIELGDSKSPLVQINISPNHESRSIIAVQANGSMTLAAADLKTSSSGKLFMSSGTGKIRIMSAVTLSPHDAGKSVLKAREDIQRDVAPDALIVVAAFRIQTDEINDLTLKGVHYGAWSITKHQNQMNVQRLFEHQLPPSSHSIPKHRSPRLCTFGPRASSLILKTSHDLEKFDITGLVPRRACEWYSSSLAHQDILLVSNTLGLIAYHDSFQLVDFEYQSKQASLDLNSTLLRRKRKRGGSESLGIAIDFVCHFAQLDRVVMYSRSHLIACDLKKAPALPRTSQRSSLLINNIGRGKRDGQPPLRPLALNIGRKEASETAANEWPQLRESLEQKRQAGSPIDFETTLLTYLKKWSGFDVKGRDNCPRYSTTSLSEVQVDYILSGLFALPSTDDAEQGQDLVCLEQVTPKLIRWLSKAGILSRWRIGKALKVITGTDKEGLAAGVISQALLNADPTYELLVTYVKNNHVADTAEQTANVKLLLGRIFINDNRPAQQLITNGQNAEMIENDLAEPTMVALAAPNGGDTTKLMTFLTEALSSLARADTKSISLNLRASFSGAEILALIQLLRQQLFKTGYPESVLRSHEQVLVEMEGENDAAAKKFDSTTKTLATVVKIDDILKILSACIDAIGPLDLLSQEENDPFLESVIPDLLSEISFASQAAEESADVYGTLRETLRYAQSDKSTSRTVRGRVRESLVAQQSGEIVTLYWGHTEGEKANEQPGVLPLSLQAEDAISPIKVRKGGGQISKRSLRHTLMLESRHKGEYSFERLII